MKTFANTTEAFQAGWCLMLYDMNHDRVSVRRPDGADRYYELADLPDPTTIEVAGYLISAYPVDQLPTEH